MSDTHLIQSQCPSTVIIFIGIKDLFRENRTSYEIAQKVFVNKYKVNSIKKQNKKAKVKNY